MTLSGTIYDTGAGRRVCLLKKAIKHMDRVIQKIAIRFSNPDIQFAVKLRAQRLPVFLEYQTQVLFFPMFDDGSVDHTGFRIPKRDRAAV